MSPERQDGRDVDKCHDTLVTRHRDYYYAALFSDPEHRDTLMASFALLEEIRRIPHNCTEAELARTKLTWWSQEFQRLKNGEARHPATRSLQGLEIPHDLLAAFLEGVLRDLEYDAYPSQIELTDLARRIGGNSACITARLLGLGEQRMEPAERVGTALALGQLVLNVAAHARRGRVYLPLDVLQAAGIDPSQLQQQGRLRDSGLDSTLREILRGQTEHIQSMLKPALAELPTELNHLNILARFQALRFERQAKHKDVLAEVKLYPLHQLWVAWRSARRSS